MFAFLLPVCIIILNHAVVYPRTFVHFELHVCPFMTNEISAVFNSKEGNSKRTFFITSVSVYHLVFNLQLFLLKNVNFIRLVHVTVLVLIKLTNFAVALRLRCGSCKLIFWSLVRLRVARRLTRLQTMYNVLKYCKKW